MKLPTHLPRRHVADGEDPGPIQIVPVEVRDAPERKDPAFLAFKRARPCLAVDCGSPCDQMELEERDPHHDPTVGSGRWDDRKTGSLCRGHHVEVGQRARLGDWDRWRTKYEIAKDQIDAVCDYGDGK